MFKKNLIASAVLLSTSATALVSATAVAQDTAAVERIEVTGSRITRTDMETASPVTVISAENIAKGGFKSVDEILAVQPSAAGMSMGGSSNNGSGGKATINLRGMGAQRTLVLLNGRRMVASGTGADSSVDLNTIPVAMIKSIEILKDGASAVYGSDAIAGVVNIITKKDFVGTALTADFSQTDKGDGTASGFSVLQGNEVADGNLVMGFQYSERGKVIQSDRDFTPAASSSFVPSGSLAGMVPNGEGGFKDRDYGYDYSTSSYAQTPNKIYSFFTAFNKEIATDTELSVDAMYTLRDSKQQMAPQPAKIQLDRTMLDSKFDDQFAKTDKDGELIDTLEYRRRMVDAGPRIYAQETNTYRISAGLKGYLDNDDTWEMSATYGRNDAKSSMANATHSKNLEQSIYAHQDLWFSGNTIDRDFLVDENVIYTEENEGGNEQFTLSMVYSGVSESDIGYAFGIENRFESAFYTPDIYTQKGESTAAQQDPTTGDYNVYSMYAEFSVPVTDAIAVESAVRYDDYSTFGGATTWKVGTTYTFNEDLMFRAVRATGFRAPSVSELYSGNSGSFDYLTDPWGNEIDQQILVNRTAGENLQPEASDSFTLGMVWDVNETISTTVDYWKFDISDAITRLNVQEEMNMCFAGNVVACHNVNITLDGDLTNLTSALTNVGSQETAGIDWNFSYTGDVFKVALDTTYLLDFTEDGVDYTGTVDGNYGAYSELKSTMTVNADITEQLSVQYIAQYIHGMDGNAWGEAFATDSVVYHNVSATYYLNDDWVINAGVQNLLDKEPEVVPNGSDMDTVPEVYDTVGRTFHLSTSYNF
ncbi:TonB-dependent receptor plug domain-containing protein [Thalassotalea aquiviva]|uniref:TonB-dependent receptor plug domain-containing protein n=1 Tax=Thalassotalea aquiviva TaxID=3242415 RepID=UPI00352A197E